LPNFTTTKNQTSEDRFEMAEKDMPRKAVIARVAREERVSKVEAERLVRTVLEAIADQLAKRGRFHVAEIGSLSIAVRPPRRYFNPRTRRDAVSHGDTALKINISKQMRERLNGDEEFHDQGSGDRG
jgi:nucleoid DNA-binding protein